MGPEATTPVSPAREWSFAEKLAILAWEWSWVLLAGWTPKPFNPWRLLLLKVFGAGIEGRPFVHPRARVLVPWKIHLADKACIGSRANLYSLDRISVGARSIVAQEAYLCTGTHRLENGEFPLHVAPVDIGCEAFVAARAFVLPGLKIGDRSTLGAGAVLTRSLPDGQTWAGNPARPLPAARSGPS